MKKLFIEAQIKDLLNQVHNEKITFSRFVEILNEQVNEQFKEIELALIAEDYSTLIPNDENKEFYEGKIMGIKSALEIFKKH